MIFSRGGTPPPQRKRVNDICKLLLCMLMLGCLTFIASYLQQRDQRLASSSLTAQISEFKAQSQLEKQPNSALQEITIEAAKTEFPTEAWDSIMDVYQRINQSSLSSTRDGNHSNNFSLPVLRKRQFRVPDMECPEPDDVFGGAWCAEFDEDERHIDPTQYFIRCGDEIEDELDRYCEDTELCINVEATAEDGHHTVVCVQDDGEVTDVGNDKDMTIYKQKTHLMMGKHQIEGTSKNDTSFLFKEHGQQRRYRAVALTAFFLTYHEPFEQSQHRWLVQPKIQPVACALERTGEKLCKTDISSTSKNPYICESTKFHNVEETTPIHCSFELAATQIALFVYVVVWRDPIVKSIVL
ncbi:hypothetical protein BCR37DRAFT_405250 [Protomyces lactucae-debilis]|uniref:Uncharacterized protein n=1 Tax=Protomyces lactucae-debilis TaxID=2754530 RepID=A0A1Y2F4Z7_PROLT|nr:uncharacterized protein BCR37DRAFT_405250 [Protomyces lactucae-debilis]ORY78980.1 hypothetical protein BCR37DRAFT_405250 [Protomyces lactucae-debilis]